MPSLLLHKKCIKFLEKLPKKLKRKIVLEIEGLQVTPFPSGYKKLKNVRDAYRIRVEDYRILYTFQEKDQRVNIYLIAHRREVYR